MASENCHMTAGSSGEPKFRQSETARGVAPVVATFRYASASASCAPVYGSSLAYRPLPSVAMATPRPVSSSTRIIPESSGWASTVLPCTKWSYWEVIRLWSPGWGRHQLQDLVLQLLGRLRTREFVGVVGLK